MSARKPFTFTSTPISRTEPSRLAGSDFQLGSTVWTSYVDSDGNLSPDSDREVLVYTDTDALSRGVYVLASTLSPKAELKVGDHVKVSPAATTSAGGSVYYGNREQLAVVTYVGGRNAEVRAVGGTYAGKGQTVGLTFLTKTDAPTDDSVLKVGDRVEYIGTETSRHIGKVGTVTRVDSVQTGRYAGAHWTADGDTRATGSRMSYVRNLRKITTPAAPTKLAAGQYVVTSAPVFGASPLSARDLTVGEVVTLEEGLNTPDTDGDVRVRTRSAGLVWVRASVLSPVILPTAAAPAPEPTLAERFPVGRLVVTSADPKTKEGGYVAPEFRGVVAEVKGSTFGDVRITLPNGERPFLTNIVGPAHLTLLPEGVELVKPTVREPLTFTDAYEKAVAHRGAPTTAKQVAKASKLAELLIEVSK
jgi:predicted RecA/RadA family phage recombinase